MTKTSWKGCAGEERGGGRGEVARGKTCVAISFVRTMLRDAKRILESWLGGFAPMVLYLVHGPMAPFSVVLKNLGPADRTIISDHS